MLDSVGLVYGRSGRVRSDHVSCRVISGHVFENIDTNSIRTACKIDEVQIHEGPIRNNLIQPTDISVEQCSTALFSPATHPDLSETHDGTSQNVISRVRNYTWP
jgi:hypothetical protein